MPTHDPAFLRTFSGVLIACVMLRAPASAGGDDDDADAVREHFLTAGVCAMCHSNSERASAMRDAAGRPVAPYDLWHASMMASASIDPLWRAAVSAEVAATPSRRVDIEKKCVRCHASMASILLERHGRAPALSELLSHEDDLSRLAADGVSCTLCHQIEPSGLGEAESFGGRFVIGTERRIYGPHARPFAHPMQHHTGFSPTRAEHVTSSALCATCHTLTTAALAEDGSPTGHRLLEQAPYLEWRNSAFSTELGGTGREPPHANARSCQDCHAPTTDEDGTPIETRIARNPGGFDFPPTRPRAPFGRHVFAGGNTLVPAILRDHAGALGVAAPPAMFDRVIERTRRQLRTDTARLEIGAASEEGGVVEIPVRITNLTGHKLPTGYPSRRLWLRAELRDADGKVVFSCGDFDLQGRIVGADGEPLASELAGGPQAAHRAVVDSPDDVQVYESLLEDSDGHATYTLLRAARYRKDNRLLPDGWDPERARRGDLASRSRKRRRLPRRRGHGRLPARARRRSPPLDVSRLAPLPGAEPALRGGALPLPHSGYGVVPRILRGRRPPPGARRRSGDGDPAASAE